MAITYEQSAALMSDFVFRGRIKVACLNYAQFILNELPNVPGHSSRYRWAQDTVRNPDQTATGVQPPVVMDPVIQDKGATATDAELQSAVEGVINKIM